MNDWHIKYSEHNLPLILIIILMMISLADQTLPGLRYLKYFVIPLCFVLLLSYKRLVLQIGCEFYFYIGISFAYFFWFFVIGQVINIEDVVFVLCYILPFLIFIPNHKYVNKIFYGLIILSIVNFIFNYDSSIVRNFINSESAFEHHELGFIFAVFFLYFHDKKEYLLAFVAFLFCFIIMKRISFGALIFALLFKYIYDFLKVSRLHASVIAVLVNLTFLYFYSYIISDDFNLLVLGIFDISSNHLLQGRVQLYSALLDWYDLKLFWGLGPGGIYQYTQNVLGSGGRILLHSDVLKIAAEFGILFLAIFIFLIYNNKNIPIHFSIYLNIILITDNIIIYPAVMFIFIYLSICLSRPVGINSLPGTLVR